jgi:uncharacterized membrane protein
MAAAQTLARGLGLFSLGLGLYQVVAPRRFATLIGVRPRPDAEATTRAVGARELGAGAGLLVGARPAWMWMRVAGDLMDLVLLSRAMRARDARRDRVGTVFASAVGVTALDVVGSVLVTRDAQRNGRNGRNGRSGHRTGPDLSAVDRGAAHRRDGGDEAKVVRSVTIQRPRADVYAWWRDFTNLPTFMRHLDEVRVDDPNGGRSHWRAKAPFGTSVEWDAELIEDVPDERIAWRSLPGAGVRNAGTVTFRDAPGDRGTVVRVELEYDPPGGPLGVAIAKLSGEEPATQTAEDLRRLKAILETGEVPVSESTLGGRRLRQRPAQPLEPSDLAATTPETVAIPGTN